MRYPMLDNMLPECLWSLANNNTENQTKIEEAGALPDLIGLLTDESSVG